MPGVLNWKYTFNKIWSQGKLAWFVAKTQIMWKEKVIFSVPQFFSYGGRNSNKYDFSKLVKWRPIVEKKTARWIHPSNLADTDLSSFTIRVPRFFLFLVSQTPTSQRTLLAILFEHGWTWRKAKEKGPNEGTKNEHVSTTQRTEKV